MLEEGGFAERVIKFLKLFAPSRQGCLHHRSPLQSSPLQLSCLGGAMGAFGGAVGASASHPMFIPPPHFPETAVLPPASHSSVTSLILRGHFFFAELAGVELQRHLNRRQGPSTLSAKRKKKNTLMSKSRQIIPKVL